MTDVQSVAFSNAIAQEGLIKEAVRRARTLPRYAAAEPEALERTVRQEVDSGNLTLFGIMRSLTRKV